MDVSLSRLSIPVGESDPHGWNSWNNYRNVHERRLAEHHFVDPLRENTLEFADRPENELELRGRVFCHRNVRLDVEKLYETRYLGRGRTRQVRCYSYLYVGWIPGSHLILKYHNHHANPDDYVHRVYDPTSGQQVFSEVIHRHQFPVFSEVLDELEIITRPLTG